MTKAKQLKKLTLSPRKYVPSNGKARSPCISSREMADEVGLSLRSFSIKMGKKNGAPHPVFRTAHDTWWNAPEVRSWWKGETSGDGLQDL